MTAGRQIPRNCNTGGGVHAGRVGQFPQANGRPGASGSGPDSGRFVPSTCNSSAPRGGFEGSMTAPWRKTVSIFKQPVTLVHTTNRKTRPAPTNNPLVNAKTTKDKPKQVFWSKRLEGLRAMRPVAADDFADAMKNAEKQENGSIEVPALPEQTALPGRIQPLGPNVSDVSAIGCLNASLSNSSSSFHPVMGQTTQKRNLESNISAFVNPDQPLMQAVVVQDQDIAAQEKRVLDARRRLEELRKHFG